MLNPGASILGRRALRYLSTSRWYLVSVIWRCCILSPIHWAEEGGARADEAARAGLLVSLPQRAERTAGVDSFLRAYLMP